MSAPTSNYGRSSSGRASVPGTGDSGRSAGRAGVPSDYRRGQARSDNWPPRTAPAGPGGPGGPGGPPPQRPGGGSPYRGGKRKPRWGRIALVAGIVVVVAGLIAGISLYGYASGLDKDLKRTNAF